MRRWIIWAGLLVLALFVFYVAWPAWSGHQISKAIEADDPASLEQKIDFPLVRQRARPVFAAEMDRRLDQLKRDGGLLGAAIAGQLKTGAGDRLVEAAVESLLTPERVIEMVRQGRDLRRAWRSFADRKIAAPADATVGTASNDQPPAQRRRITLTNLKSYRITGPSSIAIGIARDPEANEPDATVEMSFVGTGWKVTGILPKL